MTAIKHWTIFGIRVTLWRWRNEKRKGALGLSGIGFIFER